MALAGKSPDERAKELIDGTHLDDVAVRKQLYEGGKAAVDASNDPLIVLMRSLSPRPVPCTNATKMTFSPVLRKNAGNIAKLRFSPKAVSVFLPTRRSRFA